MLLNFTVKNYKSFRDENIFSMVPAPKQKGLDYSICCEKIKRKNVKALCSAVMYGPNASGKTNIIGAMDTFRAIVLRGNIRNSKEQKSPNAAAYSLELIPNKDSDEPVVMSIEFVDGGIKFGYSMTLDLGHFLDEKSERRVLSERLLINDEMIFDRSNTLTMGKLSAIKDHLLDSDIDSNISLDGIAEKSLINDELFLTGGFKLLFSQRLAKQFTDWLTDKFEIIYQSNDFELISNLTNPQKKTVYIDNILEPAAKLFGINSNDIGFVSGEDGLTHLCSCFDTLSIGSNAAIPAEIYESLGTIRFINIFPFIIRALRKGGTLVMDEFDASIHPMALMNIINIFHNDEVNIHHAQLIFNTHNPIFLNSNMFRRDEIKFVDRDEETHESTIYALSDFGTSGEKGVRKGDDYMKNYFIDQYGAISDIDFTDLIKNVLGIGEEAAED